MTYSQKIGVMKHQWHKQSCRHFLNVWLRNPKKINEVVNNTLKIEGTKNKFTITLK